MVRRPRTAVYSRRAESGPSCRRPSGGSSSVLSWWLVEPAVEERFECLGPQVVELVTAVAAGGDESRVLEQVEVLRDRLPRHRQLVLGCKPRADLEQGLALTFGQLVED